MVARTRSRTGRCSSPSLRAATIAIRSAWSNPRSRARSRWTGTWTKRSPPAPASPPARRHGRSERFLEPSLTRVFQGVQGVPDRPPERSAPLELQERRGNVRGQADRRAGRHAATHRQGRTAAGAERVAFAAAPDARRGQGEVEQPIGDDAEVPSGDLHPDILAGAPYRGLTGCTTASARPIGDLRTMQQTRTRAHGPPETNSGSDLARHARTVRMSKGCTGCKNLTARTARWFRCCIPRKRDRIPCLACNSRARATGPSGTAAERHWAERHWAERHWGRRHARAILGSGPRAGRRDGGPYREDDRQGQEHRGPRASPSLCRATFRPPRAPPRRPHRSPRRAVRGAASQLRRLAHRRGLPRHRRLDAPWPLGRTVVPGRPRRPRRQDGAAGGRPQGEAPRPGPPDRGEGDPPAHRGRHGRTGPRAAHRQDQAVRHRADVRGGRGRRDGRARPRVLPLRRCRDGTHRPPLPAR